MLLIINSLETPKVAPLPNIMELETPVALVAVFCPIYMLLDTDGGSQVITDGYIVVAGNKAITTAPCIITKGHVTAPCCYVN